MVRSPLFLLERDLSVPGSQTDFAAVSRCCNADSTISYLKRRRPWIRLLILVRERVGSPCPLARRRTMIPSFAKPRECEETRTHTVPLQSRLSTCQGWFE